MMSIYSRMKRCLIEWLIMCDCSELINQMIEKLF